MTVKTYVAGADINPCAIVKFDDNGKIVTAASSTDDIAGVADAVYAAEGDATDVCHSGEYEVFAGESISAGAFLTADEAGLAINAGEGDNTIGFALESGEANDTIKILVAPGRVTFTSEITAETTEG